VAGLVDRAHRADAGRRGRHPHYSAVVGHDRERIVMAEEGLQVDAGHRGVAEHGDSSTPVAFHDRVEGGADTVPEGLIAVGEHGHRVVKERP